MLDTTNDLRFTDDTALTTTRTKVAKQMAPNSDWTAVGYGGHFVQFYEGDGFIIDSIVEYLIHGLRSGDTCIVAATREHLAAIELKIEAFGLDIETPRNGGCYIELDAEEILARIMVNGMPDHELFQKHVGAVVADVAKTGHRIRIFGELVNVLCTRENYDAAGTIENYWHELSQTYQFSLFCAYATLAFKDPSSSSRMADICAAHSHVIPDETYTLLQNNDERLRKVAALQQRIKQLESELLEFKPGSRPQAAAV